MIYTLIYLFNGNLPWDNLKAKNKTEKYQKILEVKMNISNEKLFKKLPKEFECLLEYVRSLHFDGIPDYDMMKGELSGLLEVNVTFDNVFYDWNEKKKNESSNECMNLSTASDKKSDQENIINLKKKVVLSK